MLTFTVAYIRVAGADLILVPVDDTFGDWSHAEQLAAVAEFRRYAVKTGMTGTVAPVWKNAAGRGVFFVPPSLRPVVEVLTWEFVTGCINYRLGIRPRNLPVAGKWPPVGVHALPH